MTGGRFKAYSLGVVGRCFVRRCPTLLSVALSGLFAVLYIEVGDVGCFVIVGHDVTL